MILCSADGEPHHQLIIAEAQNHHPTERGVASEERGGDRGGSGPGTLGVTWGRRCWEDGGRMAIFVFGTNHLQMRFLYMLTSSFLVDVFMRWLLKLKLIKLGPTSKVFNPSLLRHRRVLFTELIIQQAFLGGPTL